MLGAVVASSSALAAPIQYDQDHDRYEQDHGHDRDHRDDDRRDHDRHEEDRREVEHDRREGDHRDYVIVHDRGQHEGWYRRGGYVPVEYRDHRYVVENWNEYHLAPPPRDYQYVRSDTGEFLLVAVATGIIANIVLSH
ncbi:hypothetical protein DVT68_02410 [Dyella solisilvae]|uniref:RcnB family protein n=2 Tax=Dyella solisilvae TaxID=1920168 RepID=A0A370KDC2_9GAMM|nr:hypothetical protein DVT68_02410 [Dyella solisilvae]